MFGKSYALPVSYTSLTEVTRAPIYMKGTLKLVCKALTGTGANVFIPRSVGVHT